MANGRGHMTMSTDNQTAGVNPGDIKKDIITTNKKFRSNEEDQSSVTQ